MQPNPTYCLILALLALLSIQAAAQEPATTQSIPPADARLEEPEVLPRGDTAEPRFRSLKGPQPHYVPVIPDEDMPQRDPAFWPTLSPENVAWLAVVVVLLLMLRFRPPGAGRNLDALVLAGMSLLLLTRDATATLWAGRSLQSWTYLLLTIAVIYWVLRGVYVAGAKTINRPSANASGGALFVLVLAGLAIAGTRLATEPLSEVSRDGIRGGFLMTQSGRLPYGDLPASDGQSPLLYTVHAGAMLLKPPIEVAEAADPSFEAALRDPDAWARLGVWEEADIVSGRLVNVFLFALTLLALYVIGRRLHSVEGGATLVAIFAIFPGALECLGRPDIMLPTMLMSWTFALALVPGLGGLLAAVCAVFAGLAWPWAWLALPVLLGYFFRSGWQALGSIVGTLAGFAVLVAGLTWLAAPAPPLPEAALARANMTPEYKITRGPDDVLRVTEYEAAPDAPRGWLTPLWRFLVNKEALAFDTNALSDQQSRVFVEGVQPDELLFRNLAIDPTAHREVLSRYRAEIDRATWQTDAWASLRTVIERTWLPKDPVEPPASSAWAFWSRNAEPNGRWLLARKIAKLAAALVAVVIGILLLRRRHASPVNLAGGLLVIAATVLLVSETGPVAYFAWLTPFVLIVWAGYDTHAPQTVPARPKAAGPDPSERVHERLQPEAQGPAPRISVDQ